MREQLKAMFLDWVNNYLHHETFADAHGLDYGDAVTLISIGKRYHEEDCQS